MILIVYVLGALVAIRGLWVMIRPAMNGHQYIGLAELVLGIIIIVIAALVS